MNKRLKIDDNYCINWELLADIYISYTYCVEERGSWRGSFLFFRVLYKHWILFITRVNERFFVFDYVFIVVNLMEMLLCKISVTLKTKLFSDRQMQGGKYCRGKQEGCGWEREGLWRGRATAVRILKTASFLSCLEGGKAKQKNTQLNSWTVEQFKKKVSPTSYLPSLSTLYILITYYILYNYIIIYI